MILFRYFAKEVFGTMFAVAGIVLVISMGWRFSGYLTEAANGQLSKDILFLVMAYRLPGFLELIVPISFFLAIMLTYGRFYVDSEMVILQACGLGPGRLIFITLSMALVVMVITATMTLWLKPRGEEEVERLFAGQQNLTEFDTLVPGRFQNLRSGKRVTYTEDFTDDGDLANLFINEYRTSTFDGPKDVITVSADHGEAVEDAIGNRFLVLRDGTRYDGKPGRKDYRVIQYEEYGQLIEKERGRVVYRRRTAIPTTELMEMKNATEISELQWRLSMIILVPMIAMMAVPLSRVNPRQGRFTRLVPGMLGCFIYVVSLSAARSAVEKGQLPPGLGIWWIHGIVAFVIYLLYHIHWFMRPLEAIATMVAVRRHA